MDYIFPRLNAQDVPSDAFDDAHPLEGYNVLVVDSAIATRRIYQDQLNQLGVATVVFVNSVAEVYEQLSARDFALMICEYQLDDERNGQQLLEELRVSNRLSWNTAFMMVSGERSYSKVVSVAEFAPDAYLIKPFSGAAFSDRVLRVLKRKHLLADVYRARSAEGVEELEALRDLCRTLQQIYPQYQDELQRIQVDALLKLGQVDRLQELLFGDVVNLDKPWVSFYLAKMYVELGVFEAAKTLLKKVLASTPEYLAASDLLAEVLWAEDNPESALEILERLGPKALGSSTRLRQLGNLSICLGDAARSRRYFSWVVERSLNTALFHMHDVFILSKAYVEEGRDQEVAKLTSRLRHSMNSSDLEAPLKMLDIQRQISEGDIDRAQGLLNAFFSEYANEIQCMDAAMLTCLLEMCFAVDFSSRGYDLVPWIANQKPPKAMLDRVRLAIERFKNSGVGDGEEAALVLEGYDFLARRPADSGF